MKQSVVLAGVQCLLISPLFLTVPSLPFSHGTRLFIFKLLHLHPGFDSLASHSCQSSSRYHIYVFIFFGIACALPASALQSAISRLTTIDILGSPGLYYPCILNHLIFHKQLHVSTYFCLNVLKKRHKMLFSIVHHEDRVQHSCRTQRITQRSYVILQKCESKHFLSIWVPLFSWVLLPCLLMGVDGWCFLTHSMSLVSHKALWHHRAVKTQKVQHSWGCCEQSYLQMTQGIPLSDVVIWSSSMESFSPCQKKYFLSYLLVVSADILKEKKLTVL